ncbi:MAG TPA: ribosome small subunit-dependent GTPase A [Burkholderiales bacterium]|nr:ribosome small subunit-dependent GTPase A [Burkholderiales bacterium]
MTEAKSRAQPTLHTGQVVAAFGRSYRIELADGTHVECATRGKRSDIACGDRVTFQHSGDNSGVIESILPRSTLLYRSDAHKQKLIAANVTQVIIVIAAVPSFYDDLINRCLAACEHGGIAPLIVLNKDDLPQSAAAWDALAIYRTLGYRVIRICAKQDVTPLTPLLENQTSVLVGQSGMGKSTLINRLIPGALLRVAETSLALDSGKHTTTGARLLHINASSHLIDSPGLQVFGLHHINLEDTAQAFVEFRTRLGQCRFRDCTHRVEPGCAIAQACSEGRIAAARLASYRTLAEEGLRAKARQYD